MGTLLSFPLLLASGTVAGAFYGSILSFQFLNRIGLGLVVGGAVGSALLLRYSEVIGASPLLACALHGAFVGCDMWAALIWGCWVRRDRFKPGVYGTIDHAYLEAVADGVMVVNCPITAAFTSSLCALAYKLLF